VGDITCTMPAGSVDPHRYDALHKCDGDDCNSEWGRAGEVRGLREGTVPSRDWVGAQVVDPGRSALGSAVAAGGQVVGDATSVASGARKRGTDAQPAVAGLPGDRHGPDDDSGDRPTGAPMRVSPVDHAVVACVSGEEGKTIAPHNS
jgi:hypothetical protein